MNVPAGSTDPLRIDLPFATITGPTYEVTLRLLTDTASGAHSFGSGGQWAHSLELLDTIAPETRIDGTTSGILATGNTAAMRFSSPDTDVIGFECSLDGSAFRACASPVSYPLLRVGQHSFRVRARDDTGHIDPTPAAWSWQVIAACSDGAATVQAGTVTRLRLPCTTFDGQPLTTFIRRPPALGSLGPIDPATQTVAFTAPVSAGMTSFSYRGPLNQTSRFQVTIRGPIGSGVHAAWHVGRDTTTARRLSVTDVPARATVSVRCARKGCSYHRRWPATAAKHTALNLVAGLAHRRLRPGTVVDVRIAAPYATAEVVRYTIRAHRPPRRTAAQPPRSKK